MTILGQLLEESGIEKGMERGRAEGIEITKKAFKLLNQGASVEEIAEKLQITVEEAKNLID